MHPLPAQLLHVGRDGIEDARRGRLGLKAECETDLPIEVAAPERRVLTVGEAEAGLGEAVTHGPEGAGLPDP